MLAMKYIKLGDSPDFTTYFAYLKEMQSVMPLPAWEYASKPQHWDWTTKFCPHDYAFKSFVITRVNSFPAIIIEFQAANYLHRFSYVNVLTYDLDGIKNFENNFRTLSTQLIIDELIFDAGTHTFTHTIALTYNGYVVINAKEFKHDWVSL